MVHEGGECGKCLLRAVELFVQLSDVGGEEEEGRGISGGGRAGKVLRGMDCLLAGEDSSGWNRRGGAGGESKREKKQ